VTEEKAYLECRCGACRISLVDPQLRYRSECLCCDCRQRELISASKRPENKMPDEVAAYYRGVQLFYFSNALQIEAESRARLEFFKLSRDALTTTGITTCCGTLMCSNHPITQGCSIAAHADNCTIKIPDIMPTQVVLFGCDFPDDKYNERTRRDEIPKIFSVFDELDSVPVAALLAALTKSVSAGSGDENSTTFEELLVDQEIRIDGSHFDESRLEKPDS